MNEALKGLYINGEYFAMFSSLTSSNELSYVSSPTRDNSMTLVNEGIGYAYIPKINCKLGYITKEQYSKFIQQINKPKFSVQYYDVELRKNVIRQMYCTSYSLGTLYHRGPDLKGLVGTDIEFVCYYGYGNYDDLENNIIIGG